jgi:hypothetical protein
MDAKIASLVKTSLIESVSLEFYNPDDYNSYEEARDFNDYNTVFTGLHTTPTLYGYQSAIDCIKSLQMMASMFTKNEIPVRVTINDVFFKTTNLTFADDAIVEWLLLESGMVVYPV